jgi:hypothetical protein
MTCKKWRIRTRPLPHLFFTSSCYEIKTISNKRRFKILYIESLVFTIQE